MTDVTVILNAIDQGNAKTADLLPFVYDELRRLAAGKMERERPGQTLQPTALVHEAFLRLIGDNQATWQNRRHFFGAAAMAMQRILVDQARHKQRIKRGGNLQQMQLSNIEVVAQGIKSDTDLLALDEALTEFAVDEANKAELVRLRYFAGLSEEEAANTLGISRATASRWWTFSKAWLFARIHQD